MDMNNIFAALPDKQEKEFFEVLQHSENIRIERIVSIGHTSPKTGWYDQAENEWVIIIKGEAIMTFEDKKVTMQAGSYINIPAHTKHKVSWTKPQQETVWLAVFY
jgi:cupin 2 domain-containing protein